MISTNTRWFKGYWTRYFKQSCGWKIIIKNKNSIKNNIWESQHIRWL